ncbi:MAG TPA: hypothetical protein VL333_13030 [Candidatus Saccharimonadales bacterium]|jgi:hypothetical protein|nr:hypothetical protein [Candidatus Saccharimonadales bacterium]
MERVALLAPFSTMQEIVVDLLGVGLTYTELAVHLKISEEVVREHAKRAARKIPSDLPTQMRCIVWARGATLDVLQGLTLRYEVQTRSPSARTRPPVSTAATA